MEIKSSIYELNNDMETRHCLFSRFQDTHGIDFFKKKFRPSMIPQEPAEKEQTEKI